MGGGPDLDDLGPLSEGEWAALRSLHHAYVEMEQELAAARAMAGRLSARAELASDGQGGPCPYYADAVGDLWGEALHYERKAGELAWRYASAAVVLGVSVWHRLATQQPPLTEQVVASLASREPTLGELKGALKGLYAEVIATQPDSGERPVDQEVHEALLSGIDRACINLTHILIGGRWVMTRPAAEPLDKPLTTAYPESADPLWDDLIRSALYLSEQLPYDIASWIDRSQAAETATTS
ncbi:hypothetical protein AB0H77_31170 [Streptomyces sp. NPDC050844]|uniref:hypothetical protein n=1 Tax=Streptomyces sp. NPDC050844 TaxID=3155790 RepID=UPI0033D74341